MTEPQVYRSTEHSHLSALLYSGLPSLRAKTERAARTGNLGPGIFTRAGTGVAPLQRG
jgi:hypothetical protein